jgi:hypothetical protein
MITNEKLKKILNKPVNEHPTILLSDFFKNNNIIVVNALKTHTGSYSNLMFTINRYTKNYHINVSINDYNLMILRISLGNKLGTLTSIDIYKIIDFINDFTS